MSIVLVYGRDHSVLWSQELRQQADRLADLHQQLGFSAARVLNCTLEGLAAGIDRQTLRLYLNGCAGVAALTGQNFETLIPLFREVVTKEPRFEGAWAKLLYVQGGAVLFRGMSIDPSVRRSLQRDIESARALNPNMPEVFEAEATLLPWNDFQRRMSLLDEAVRRNPRDSFAYARRSLDLVAAGRMNDAVRDAQRAAELDPLSPISRGTYILVLGYSGNVESALNELDEADRLWPGASNIVAARYSLHLRYGDPAEALAMLRSGATMPEHRLVHETFLKARVEPSDTNVRRAIAAARASTANFEQPSIEYVQALGAFGKLDELLALPFEDNPDLLKVLFRPAFRAFWRDPRSMRVAKRLGLLDYWHDSRQWPDFCLEPDLPYNCATEAKKLKT